MLYYIWFHTLSWHIFVKYLLHDNATSICNAFLFGNNLEKAILHVIVSKNSIQCCWFHSCQRALHVTPPLPPFRIVDVTFVVTIDIDSVEASLHPNTRSDSLSSLVNARFFRDYVGMTASVGVLAYVESTWSRGAWSAISGSGGEGEGFPCERSSGPRGIVLVSNAASTCLTAKRARTSGEAAIWI